MNFSLFKQAVSRQFANMSQFRLYAVDIEGDVLWDTYLRAFPEGTNPIYQERTEHDCTCCRQFIKNAGKIVAIIGDEVVSIWDIGPTGTGYDTVAKALLAAVRSRPIANVYKHYERSVGTDKSFEQLVDGQKAWEHFFINLPTSAVASKHTLPTLFGQKRTAYDMLNRAMETITDEAVDTVLELINQNSIYRGAEHLVTVQRFKNMVGRSKLFRNSREVFVWKEVEAGDQAVNFIRNSVIGTLLVDLSEGVSLDRAVASFESKVAPANYKRPTALVTKAMIESAKKKVAELGLLSALERRYATIDDIKINDILFANATARRVIVKDVFEELAGTVKANPKLDKVEEVTIEKFIADILPTATGIELLVENRHAGNLVSLIAPVDPTAPGMFKWDNGFSWSYNGNMADSIKERVKAAGGNVTGELCCRLAWDYTDDLDFHMLEPDYHLFYSHRSSPNGGTLDVDANCNTSRLSEHPVENIFYTTTSKMKPGEYLLQVQNYCRRSEGRGFTVEIDLFGTVYSFEYDKVVATRQHVDVAKIIKDKAGVTVKPILPSTKASKVLWGVTTQTFVPVTVMMLSPNFWEGGVGNKHYFFMLEGCLNDGTARGFFNEYLKSELDQHRKVIEMIGSRMKTELSERQLSGLGFSSTQRNSITCRVTGNFTRNITIAF